MSVGGVRWFDRANQAQVKVQRSLLLQLLDLQVRPLEVGSPLEAS